MTTHLMKFAGFYGWLDDEAFADMDPKHATALNDWRLRVVQTKGVALVNKELSSGKSRPAVQAALNKFLTDFTVANSGVVTGNDETTGRARATYNDVAAGTSAMRAFLDKKDTKGVLKGVSSDDPRYVLTATKFLPDALATPATKAAVDAEIKSFTDAGYTPTKRGSKANGPAVFEI